MAAGLCHNGRDHSSEAMFFKREKTKVLSFVEQMDQLRSAGYTAESTAAGTFVRKGGFAATVKEGADGRPAIVDSGLAIGNEVALLTDLGYQKIFMTASGKQTAAVADHLRGLHNFVEDLREALGLTSLYNESLGTTNEQHLYDRVTLRDEGATPKPWLRR